MAQANWTRKLDWSFTSLLCCLSTVLGISIGLSITAWKELASIPPSTEDLAVNTIIPTEHQSLQAFFPGLDSAEAAVEEARITAIIRREAYHQQQLEQTREVLAFNGATTTDIEAHVIRQLAEKTTPPSKLPLSLD